MPKAQSVSADKIDLLDETKHVVKSFSYAKEGLPLAFRGRNMRVHGIATICVILANVWFGVTRTEWLITLVLVGAVWSLEMVNSAIEELANLFRDTHRLSYQATKYPRDLAAGAVLVMAAIAALCALIIYGPYLWAGFTYLATQ